MVKAIYNWSFTMIQIVCQKFIIRMMYEDQIGMWVYSNDFEEHLTWNRIWKPVQFPVHAFVILMMTRIPVIDLRTKNVGR